MRIVSWNCNGALRKKFERLSNLKGDVYIIQECEDPTRTKHNEYTSWSSNHIWIGDSKNKGLGIFTKPEITLSKLDWSSSFKDHTVKYFLPCLIDNKFQLLGVWTHQNNSPNFGYMGQFWKYLQTNINHFEDIIISGDFNSNAIWDQWDRWWNHTDVINMLKEKKIESIYHMWNNEKQGKETCPTFFHQKNMEKSFHIDYIFASKMFCKPKDFRIENSRDWITMSDHIPLILDI